LAEKYRWFTGLQVYGLQIEVIKFLAADQKITNSRLKLNLLLPFLLRLFA
jgi:hypothetical protein